MKRGIRSTLLLGALVAVTAGCFGAPSGSLGSGGPAPAPVVAPVAIGNRYGFAQFSSPLWLSDADLAADFATIAASGAHWVRFDFYWSGVQPTGPTSWDWHEIDRAVNAARTYGLDVLAMPAYTPAWARPPNTNDHYPPSNPDDFATFVRAATQRYAPLGVHSWEIWNEPNIAAFWQPKPDVVAYTNLLERASSAIRSVDPAATVMNGGTAPAGSTLDWVSSDGTQISPWHFLKGIYDQGGGPSMTAVAHHPYTGQPYPPSTIATWNAFQQTDDLYSLMASYGDGAKKIWGTEAGAWTGTSADAVSEDTQAEFIREYVAGWQAWSSFTGPFFVHTLRDPGTDLTNKEDNFGLLHFDRTEKPAMAAFRQAVAGG